MVEKLIGVPLSNYPVYVSLVNIAEDQKEHGLVRISALFQLIEYPLDNPSRRKLLKQYGDEFEGLLERYENRADLDALYKQK